jgi:hypothetical protein
MNVHYLSAKPMEKYKIQPSRNAWIISKFDEFKRTNLVIMHRPKGVTQEQFDKFIKSLKIQIQ